MLLQSTKYSQNKFQCHRYTPCHLTDTLHTTHNSCIIQIKNNWHQSSVIPNHWQCALYSIEYYKVVVARVLGSQIQRPVNVSKTVSFYQKKEDNHDSSSTFKQLAQSHQLNSMHSQIIQRVITVNKQYRAKAMKVFSIIHNRINWVNTRNCS